MTLARFLNELTPKKGSFGNSAKNLGFFVIYYFVTVLCTFVGFALVGIVSIVIPFVMLPFSLFIAYRMAKATMAVQNEKGS